MSIEKQDSNGKGSLKDIQVLINKCPEILNSQIHSAFPKLANHKIEWVSPLAKDDFSEYRDKDFLKILGLMKFSDELKDFWPSRGPQWDALGKTDEDVYFLVEAKANIPEIVSPGTAASGNSRKLIDKSLKITRSFLNIKIDVDWSGKFYQYTNRVAHLYFLREICKVNAYLLNIYFMNDKSVEHSPSTQAEWEAAIMVMKHYLGVSHHKLSKYMLDVFIDVPICK